jgi:hypothetical protein
MLLTAQEHFSMKTRKAVPTSSLGTWKVTSTALALSLALTSLTACSHAQTSTASKESPHASQDLISPHPFGDQTPAQRRAAWLKSKPLQQPAASIAQNAAGTTRR